MTNRTRQTVVLIIEDGDEYLDSLSKFVQGPVYLQAKSGEQAVRMLQESSVDLIYLDMRFDRIPMSDLLGDHVKATREHNGDPLRAYKFLQNNQGLFILEKLRKENLTHIPVILAYDFSRQQKRYEHLKSIHPSLRWVPDAVTPSEIRNLMEDCQNSGGGQGED
ncbi:MAG: hypothetical protein JXR76_16115 [Deltaproteobacteria bacterium]|nr:hypothetical protein [Deltaproteobacteria bacterium]